MGMARRSADSPVALQATVSRAGLGESPGGGGRYDTESSSSHLLEGKAVGRLRPFLRRQLPREVADRLLEIGIVARQVQRGPVLRERLDKCAAAVMNAGEAANGGKIFGCALDHHLQLPLGVVVLSELDERPSQRHAGRQVAGMKGQSGAADLDGFGVLPCPPVLLGELRERDRRRILLDPASKVFDAGVVGHRRY